ncbi:hypothetical protein V2J09_022797 [Rumex salicifolius]
MFVRIPNNVREAFQSAELRQAMAEEMVGLSGNLCSNRENDHYSPPFEFCLFLLIMTGICISLGISILLVYVDDIIMTGNDSTEQARLKTIRAREFEVKELGRMKYNLGIEVTQSKSGIFISQQKYIKDVLQDVGMNVCKPCSTAIDYNLKKGKDETEPAGIVPILEQFWFLGEIKSKGVVARSNAKAEFWAATHGICGCGSF